MRFFNSCGMGLQFYVMSIEFLQVLKSLGSLVPCPVIGIEWRYLPGERSLVVQLCCAFGVWLMQASCHSPFPRPTFPACRILWLLLFH